MFITCLDKDPPLGFSKTIKLQKEQQSDSFRVLRNGENIVALWDQGAIVTVNAVLHKLFTPTHFWRSSVLFLGICLFEFGKKNIESYLIWKKEFGSFFTVVF